MELRAYLAIIWRRKWVIVVMVAVAVTVSVVGTLTTTPTYMASATLRILTATSGSLDRVSYDINYAERLMNTYVEIATSRPVLEELVETLGLAAPPEIQVEIVPNTELMKIVVEDQDSTLAALAANTLAEILVFRTKELYSGGGRSAQEILSTQLNQAEHELSQARKEYEDLIAQSPDDVELITAASRSIGLKEDTYAMLLEQYEQSRIREALLANNLSIVQPAVAPQAPSKPRKVVNVALGFMIGLAGGIGLSLLFENLDTTLHATEQIEEVTELPILGEIPTVRRQRQVTLFNGDFPQRDAFRRLRISIFALDHDTPLRTLLITSAEPKEGKSTVAANLALAVAQSGRNVIVVDGDLRLPTLHRVFDLSNKIGLSSILKREAALDEAVQDTRIPGVQVLTSGPLPPNPAELIDSPRMTELIEQLARRFEMVLLDAPSLLAVTDATVLALATDGVVLVVGRTQARREAVQAACRHLADVKARLIGVVVNRAEKGSSYYYHRTPAQRDEQAGTKA
jgi:non-specific protein-tyrosine kinase